MSTQKLTHSVSIIIPTLNGEKTLPEFFAALGRQTLLPDEVVVGDSSSTDRTVEICTGAGAKVFNIQRAEFDHGGTRTFLAEKCESDILVFFTQDAILSKRDSLGNLVAALLQDPVIACSYGRQLPEKNASPVAAHLRTFNYPPESYVKGFEDILTDGFKTIFISNSFAAYRKDSLAKAGYFRNGLIFGEDTCTLGRLIIDGQKVAYAGEATVYHSHNYFLIEDFRRSFDIGVLHGSEPWLLENYGSAEKVGASYIKSLLAKLFSEKKYILLIDCFFRIGLKFLGYKLGRSYRRIPASIIPYLTINRLWWQK